MWYNISMDKKSKIPFVIVVLVVLSVISYLFIKTVLWQDFEIVPQLQISE
jgi:hypothetical protein